MEPSWKLKNSRPLLTTCSTEILQRMYFHRDFALISSSFLFTSQYTLYLLAKHPEIQEALYKELKTCSPTEEFTIAQVHNCPILLGVVNESLRLFPGGGAIGGRMSTE